MKKGWGFILLLFFVSLLPSTTAQASGVDFTMEAILPSNQLTEATYFDLKVSPGQEEQLSLRLKNQKDQPIKVAISPNPAFTNQNGVIEYSQYDYPKDSSAQYTVPQLLSAPQEVSLNPQESKEVTFQMKVPSDSFKGTILGGFYAREIEDQTKPQTKTQQGMLSIKNEYSLVIGLSLTEDPLQKVSPNLSLKDVKPGLANERTAVLANLQNNQPQAFGSMTVDAKIYKKGQSKIFKETKKTDQEMAPNSNYDFTIDWENQPLEAGDYHLKLEAASGSKTWQFERDFTIRGKEADVINEKAVNLPDHNYWWLLILLLVIILLLLTYYLGKRKGKQGS